MSNESHRELGTESGLEAPQPVATTDRSAEPAREEGDTSIDAQGAPVPKAKSKPKPVIASVEELLAFAYESNARLLEFSKDALKKLPITDEDVAAQEALVVSLAAADPTLSTPFKLLQYAARQGVQLRRADISGVGPALNRLVHLAVVALGQNPVFRVWMDQLLDPRKDPQLSTEHLRDTAHQVDAGRLGLAVDEFKAADSERLVKNAIACYGLLRALQREWTLDQYIDTSYGGVWRFEVPEAAGLERAVGDVGASRDHAVLGIVAANYLTRITRRDGQISQLERQATAARNREARLQEDLACARDREQTALARAEAFSADVIRLQKELAAERDNRVVDKSHMADDYETLRTRIIRRLGGEIDLLTDGLHALRNGAPHVAEEFLDRSLLALTREVEQLRDAAGGLA